MRNHKKFNVNLCGPITDNSTAPKVKWSLMSSVLQMDTLNETKLTLNESVRRILRVSATIIFTYWGNSWKIFNFEKKPPEAMEIAPMQHIWWNWSPCTYSMVLSVWRKDFSEFWIRHNHLVKIKLGHRSLEQPADLERIWAFSHSD